MKNNKNFLKIKIKIYQNQNNIKQQYNSLNLICYKNTKTKKNLSWNIINKNRNSYRVKLEQMN